MPNEAVTSQTMSNKTVSDNAMSCKTMSNKTMSNKTLSSQTMSNKTVSSQTMSNKTVSCKTMSSKTVSDKTVSNKSVSSVDHRSSMGNSNGVGHSVMSNWVSNGMDKRGSVVSNGDSLRVGSSARVGDLSDVTINVVGVVVDSLDTAVRKVDRVGSLNNTGAIVALGLAEGSARVLVSHSIVVGVGGDLSKV